MPVAEMTLPDPDKHAVVAIDPGIKHTGVAVIKPNDYAVELTTLENTDPYRATSPITMARMIMTTVHGLASCP